MMKFKNKIINKKNNSGYKVGHDLLRTTVRYGHRSKVYKHSHCLIAQKWRILNRNLSEHKWSGMGTGRMFTNEPIATVAVSVAYIYLLINQENKPKCT